MTKRFAAFDIDGTIFRWQLYHELFDEFFRRQIISELEADPVFKARREWQNRTREFVDYEMTLVEVMEKAMLGLTVESVDEAAEAVLAARGSQIYRYTSSLLSDLKKDGYVVIAISGSHQQLVEKFAAQYEIAIVYGRKFAVQDGIYTGAGEQVYGQKAQILKAIVNENSLNWQDSYAVGDTNSDGDMMDLVTHPVAFNPDRRLYERAQANGWKIVIERKDMIYELASNGKSYLLA